MQLNSKIFILLMYSLIYIACTIVYSMQGVIWGDLRGRVINDSMLLYFSLGQVLISIVIYYLATEAIGRVVFVRPKFNFPKCTHVVFLFFFISFMFFSVKYNYGFSSISVDTNVPRYLLQVYIILQPVFLGYIYSAYYSREVNKLYYFNVLLILALTVYQGWLASFIIFAVIYFDRLKGIVRKNKIVSIVLFIFSAILVPVLSFVKSIMLQFNQSGEQERSFSDLYYARLSFLNINNVSDFFSHYVLTVLGRFEHVSIVYYINLQGDALHNHVRSFYQEGWLPEFIYGVFGFTIDKPYVQKYVANLIEPLYTWQVQIPVVARFIYLPAGELCLMTLAILAVILISNFIVKLISSSQSLSSLNWVALFLFLYHGWFYSVVLWMQTLLMLLFLLSFYKMLLRLSHNNKG